MFKIRLGRWYGFAVLAAAVVAVSTASMSAAPGPCFGCECIGPSDCNGCTPVYTYDKNGKQSVSYPVWVQITGSQYRYCVRTSSEGDCYTSNITCWFANAGSLPTCYEKEGCNAADAIIVVLEVNSSLRAMRTGCGTGPP